MPTNESQTGTIEAVKEPKSDLPPYDSLLGPPLPHPYNFEQEDGIDKIRCWECAASLSFIHSLLPKVLKDLKSSPTYFTHKVTCTYHPNYNKAALGRPHLTETQLLAQRLDQAHERINALENDVRMLWNRINLHG